MARANIALGILKNVSVGSFTYLPKEVWERQVGGPVKLGKTVTARCGEVHLEVLAASSQGEVCCLQFVDVLVTRVSGRYDRWVPSGLNYKQPKEVVKVTGSYFNIKTGRRSGIRKEVYASMFDAYFESFL